MEVIDAKEIADDVQQTFDNVSSGYRQLLEDRINRLVEFKLSQKIQTANWQLCPKCNGNGNIPTFGTTTQLFVRCDVCNGSKIIAPIIIPNSNNK